MEYYFLNAVSASMGTCTFCDSHCDLVCDSHCGIVSTGGIVKELDAEEWRRQKLLGCIPFFTVPGKLCTSPRLEKF